MAPGAASATKSVHRVPNGGPIFKSKYGVEALRSSSQKWMEESRGRPGLRYENCTVQELSEIPKFSIGNRQS